MRIHQIQAGFEPPQADITGSTQDLGCPHVGVGCVIVLDLPLKSRQTTGSTQMLRAETSSVPLPFPGSLGITGHVVKLPWKSRKSSPFCGEQSQLEKDSL